MKLGRWLFRTFGPVALGVSLLAFPLLFAPDPAGAATTTDCGGYETVECQTIEVCLGIKWLGFEYCQSSTSYWPAVTMILQEELNDDFMDIDHLYDDLVYGGGGGGTF